MNADVLVLILAFFPILYSSIFVHELGHAIMGRLGGLIVTSFGVGLGRPFLRFKCRGVMVYFSRHHCSSGLTMMLFPRILPERWPTIALLSGGFLANFLLGFAALLLWWLLPVEQHFLLMIAIVNIVLGLPNLVPFRVRVGKAELSSDGGHILALLRTGRLREIPAPLILRTLKVLDPFLADIGDTRNRHLHLLDGVSAWLALGNSSKAKELCDQADALPLAGYPFHRALGALTRGLVACEAGEFELGEASLAEAHRVFTDLHQVNGCCLVQLGLVQLALARNDRVRARTFAKGLWTDPAIAAHPTLRRALLELMLLAQEGLPSRDTVELLRRQYEQTRHHGVARAGDLGFYRALGRFYADLQDWPNAAAAYRQALQAVQQLAAAFDDNAERESFQKRQEHLLVEARTCLLRSGNAKEAGELDTFWTHAEEVEQQKKARSLRHDRIMRRVGLSMLGVYCLLAAATFSVCTLIAFLDVDKPPFILMALAVFLLGYAIVAGGLSLFLIWLLPRNRTGGFILYMALLPLLVAIGGLAGILTE